MVMLCFVCILDTLLLLWEVYNIHFGIILNFLEVKYSTTIPMQWLILNDLKIPHTMGVHVL